MTAFRELLLRPDQSQDARQRSVSVCVLHNQLGIFKSLQGSLRLGPFLHVYVLARRVHACTGNRDQVLFRRFGSRHSFRLRLVMGYIHPLAQG
jgi:hypothetical protein